MAKKKATKKKKKVDWTKTSTDSDMNPDWTYGDPILLYAEDIASEAVVAGQQQVPHPKTILQHADAGDFNRRGIQLPDGRYVYEIRPVTEKGLPPVGFLG
jgi:hypothetical protein